jgi:SRSO17 transposase
MIRTLTPIRCTVEHDALAEFCNDMLRHLARSDQRQWGEIYVRGLVSMPGRKSIRRMSDCIVGGRADQGIQQFVNQSPWDWVPVRRNLAAYAATLFRPQAWVVEEAVIPKNGLNSVGVARQYSHSAGRVMNSQLGLAVFLAEGPLSAAVNWRLLLPREWDSDPVRRARSHVPEDEHHKTRWQSVVEAIDEMTLHWGLEPQPVVVDARQDIHLESLLRALEDRSLHYLVRVSAATPVSVPAVGSGQPVSTIGEFAAGLNRAGSTSVSWRDAAPRPTATSRFVAQPLPRPADVDPARWRGRARLLLAEWLPGRKRPEAMWLSDMNMIRLPQLVALARTRRTVLADMARLRDEFGLCHFEGRSFRGWHHHMTLVSLAHAFSLSQRLAFGDELTEDACA